MKRLLASMLICAGCGAAQSPVRSDEGHATEPAPEAGLPAPRVLLPALSELAPRRVAVRIEGCANEALLCRARGCEADAVVRAALVDGAAEVELEPGTWFVEGRCSDGRRSPPVAFQVTATGFTRRSRVDVNGDGYADLVVGAFAFGEPLPGAHRGPGAAFVFFGGPGGPVREPSQTIMAPEGGGFGYRLASAGDVNEDGYTDVLVYAGGAPWIGTEAGPGRVYLLLGSADGLTLDRWQFDVPPSRTRAPHLQTVGQITARGVGDVDGDGHTDVAVGISTGRATVWLFRGGPGGLSTTASAMAQSPDPESPFGDDFLGGIDLNEDGHADLAVNFQAQRRGPLYIAGSPSGISYDETVHFRPEEGCPGSSFAVADMDGDGRLELAIGAFLWGGRGFVGVYRGLTSAAPLPIWTADGDVPDEHIGRSLTAADVDGDGHTDLVTGTPIRILHGGTALPQPGRMVRGIERRESIESRDGGERLGSPGDLNGDGYADVALGAGLGSELFVHYGSAQGLEPEPRTHFSWGNLTGFGSAIVD